MVVFPLGVVISVSVFVDVLSLQPTIPVKARLEIRAIQAMRFMYSLLLKIFVTVHHFQRGVGAGILNRSFLSMNTFNALRMTRGACADASVLPNQWCASQSAAHDSLKIAIFGSR
jgi:hypothetical protein